jgi:hypothetical protein
VFICGERVKGRTVLNGRSGARHCRFYRCWRRGLAFRCGFISLEKGEQHRRQFQAELESGRWDFGEQPALFAVAQGIVKNDPEAIRAAAKSVPDLQAPGRDGTTLLNFAVRQSWQRPESVEAVRTLLSLGANPNYTNGKPNSLAMAEQAFVGARPPLNAWRQAEMRILAMSLVGR